MADLFGSYTRQLDERGRFVLPSKVREKIEGPVHITRSLVDDCLLLYTEDEWTILKEQVRDLPTTTNKAAKRFVQIVFGQSVEGEVDKQGRIALTSELLEAVGMTRDIILVGIGSKMEIWDVKKYEDVMNEADFDEILDGISQFGLNI
ncbi:MAG: division/cell wall cluster transcriptional repressor MraZ [Eubacteriales bacterium]|nr:division/cell wall cluster transcriptional repressor MraZ [Eubacteriales bacterium]